MSRIKKLASETALYGLSSIVGRLLTFVFLTPYLTRQFPKEVFGVHTDIYSWAALLTVLFTFRIETAFFRYATQKDNLAKSFRTASTLLLLSSLCLGGLLWLFASPIAVTIEHPAHADYVRIFALIISFDALAAVPFAALRLQGKALQFAALKLLNLFVHLGGILLFLELFPLLLSRGYTWVDAVYTPGQGVRYVFLANLLASGLTLLCVLPMYLRYVREWSVDKVLLRKMLRYAAPLALAGLAGVVNEVMDRQLLKWLLDGTREERLAQLGIYGACYKISIFMSLFTQAFNYAAEPFFFRNAQAQDAKPLYARVTFLFTLVGCMAFVGLTLYSDWVQYFVDAPYREGMKIVPILLLANLCLGLYYNVAVWYKLTDRTHFGGLIGVLGAAVTLGLNLLLIPYLGYMGAAWATLGCYATMLVVSYSLGQRFYPVPYRITSILGYIAFSVALFVANQGVRTYFEAESLSLFFVQTLFLILFIGVVGWTTRSTWRPLLSKLRSR